MAFKVINQYQGVNPHLNDELQDPTPRSERLMWKTAFFA